MEAQTTLVGADGGVVLDAEAAVDAGSALIIHPGNAELNHTLGLHKALQQTGGLPLGVLVHHQLKRFKHLAHSLQELRLAGVAALHLGVYAVEILTVKHKMNYLLAFWLKKLYCKRA